VYTHPHGCDHPNDPYTDEVFGNTAPVYKTIQCYLQYIYKHFYMIHAKDDSEAKDMQTFD
jgi:hypothetical protein